MSDESSRIEQEYWRPRIKKPDAREERTRVGHCMEAAITGLHNQIEALTKENARLRLIESESLALLVMARRAAGRKVKRGIHPTQATIDRDNLRAVCDRIQAILLPKPEEKP